MDGLLVTTNKRLIISLASFPPFPSVWGHIIAPPLQHFMERSHLSSLNLEYYWTIPSFSTSRMNSSGTFICLLSMVRPCLWKVLLLLRSSQLMYFLGSVLFGLSWTHHGGLYNWNYCQQIMTDITFWKQRKNVKLIYNGAMISGHSVNI